VTSRPGVKMGVVGCSQCNCISAVIVEAYSLKSNGVGIDHLHLICPVCKALIMDLDISPPPPEE